MTGSVAAPTLVTGYPLSVLQRALARRQGVARVEGGNVVAFTSRDPLTKQNLNIRLEVEPGRVTYRTTQCGPAALLVNRVSVDKQVFGGLDAGDMLTALLKGAAGELGLSEPVQIADRPAEPPRPPPPPPAPAPPVAAASPEVALPLPGSSVSGDQAQTAYTAEYRTCMASDDARDQLPAALKECAGDELARQDQRLNAAYRTTVRRLEPEAQLQLRTLERTWLADVERACRREANDTDGIMDELAYSQCKLAQTVKRTTWLEAYR